MSRDAWQRIEKAVSELYRPEDAEWLLAEIADLHRGRSVDNLQRSGAEHLSGGDACFICYADSIVDSDSEQTPLQVLDATFAEFGLAEVFPVVHLLPFFPWDTDRGFSVCDYYKVAEENGSWEDISSFAKTARLMFDFVANHASVSNPLVQHALIERHLQESDSRYAASAAYKDFVLAFDVDAAPSEQDLAALARPRSAPVLTPYCVVEKEDGSLQALLGQAGDPQIVGETILGQGVVWTTFSRGLDSQGTEATRQVDLNFKNPKVLLETLRILLFYAEQGATFIRLDAIGYLWKKLGSSSLHEAETHTLLVCLKALMELCAPQVCTVAEVNEPQDTVTAYLGKEGLPESDLVYQFSHFPLAVHAVLNGTAVYYRKWLQTLPQFSGRQFITVLGSHDGMGMKPARGLLPEQEIENMIALLIEEHGGLPNYAVLPGGKKIVYEVCATAWDLINGAEHDQQLAVARYLAVAALGLLVRGLPAFYVNGAFGLRGYRPSDGLDENRTVNRERLERVSLWATLSNADSREARVYASLQRMLELRASQPAFQPSAAAAEVVECQNDAVLVCLLPAAELPHSLLSMVNLSAAKQTVSFALPAGFPSVSQVVDLLTGERIAIENGLVAHSVSPYQVVWLTAAV